MLLDARSPMMSFAVESNQNSLAVFIVRGRAGRILIYSFDDFEDFVEILNICRTFEEILKTVIGQAGSSVESCWRTVMFRPLFQYTL